MVAPTPWLVVIDMQRVFADPQSDWATPGFADILPRVQSLVDAFAPRVVFTRFVAPPQPTGAWVPYYEQWPFALVPDDHPLYEIVPELRDPELPVLSRPTFGKWGTVLADLLVDVSGTDPATSRPGEIVLVGVSTDCCVLSTALAAADAGVHVRVVADACAGLSVAEHQRALDAMALYAPLIEITDTSSVVAGSRTTGE